eukprot:8514456-Alexandrium_andersonii.AAC.1
MCIRDRLRIAPAGCARRDRVPRPPRLDRRNSGPQLWIAPAGRARRGRVARPPQTGPPKLRSPA